MPPNSKEIVLENEDVELIPAFEKRGYATTPTLFVNGSKVPEALAKQALPNMTLLTFLRTVMGLTGSKLGCAEGGCGACTVLLSQWMPEQNEIRHASVNACLMPVLAAHECHVTTVEGVGTVKQKEGGLHPVQQAMVDMHGSQCGFCTPGIIVSLYTLLSNKKTATVNQLEEHLDGNLCRCTGYRPIWDAAKSLTLDAEDGAVGPCGTPCRECPERDECEMDCNVEDKAAEENEKICCTSTGDKMNQYKETLLKDESGSSWRDQPNEMFPEDLKTLEATTPLLVVDPKAQSASSTWIQPTTLSEMLRVVAEGNCKLVVGNTEVGIEVRFKHALYPKLVHPAMSIVELFQAPTLDEGKTTLTMGSCCPLSTIQHDCGDFAAEADNVSLARTCQPMHDMLRWFASTQIRNVACLGGNLVTASPISDMNPLLASMDATLTLTKSNKGGDELERRTCKVADFFVRYRTVALQEGEVVERVQVPVLAPVLSKFIIRNIARFFRVLIDLCCCYVVQTTYTHSSKLVDVKMILALSRRACGFN
mmetsp:Transcript_20882/g.48487  ORF Transcript_20882/g.48487 Transcript_20882/m.48487 type:complete len:536 (+) Transcript_20882:319-1926(+)